MTAPCSHSLPDVIPVFPLTGALLLPRAHLPLNIFEPRYLAMVDATLKSDHRLIGIVQPRGEALAGVGCAGRLTGFSETGDGRYLITLTGVSRFATGPEIDGFTPFRRTQPDWTPFATDRTGEQCDRSLDRAALFALLDRYFDAQGMNADWGSLRDAEDELLIDALAMLCPLEPPDKQALLEAPDLTARRKMLMTLMDYALRGGADDEVMQ